MVQSRGVAVQPSLWDRVKNDLPGIRSDIAALRARLAAEFPDLDLDRLAAMGPDGVRGAAEFTAETYGLALSFVTKSDEYDRLQAGGLSVSQDDLREAVRRDIEMLFNVERLEAEYDLSELEQGQFAAQYGDLTDEPDGDMPRRRVEMHADILDDFPHVRTSVINYGVPPFTGSQGSSIDRHALGRQLRDVLQVYEPRLRPNSIRVSVQPNGRGGLGVKIEAVLMMQPSPEKMWLNTEVDVEKGRATTSFEATQKV